MNKNNFFSFLFQNLVRFSLVAFMAFVVVPCSSLASATLNSGPSCSIPINTAVSLEPNFAFAGDIAIGGQGTLDLAGNTMNVSAIELADGSKIVSGIIFLDSGLDPASEIEQEFKSLEIIPDQNKIFDLGADSGQVLFLSALKFENGGEIIHGKIVIDASNSAGQVIREIVANAKN